jgi:hypothetical protein
MTLPGTDFFHDTEQKIEDILHFVQQEEITHIIVVSDLDCPFLSALVRNKGNALWPFENILQDLFLSQYLTVFKDKNKLMRQIKLSEVYVLYQARQLSRQLALKKKPNQKLPNIKALMCCRAQDLLKELPIKQVRYEY